MPSWEGMRHGVPYGKKQSARLGALEDAINGHPLQRDRQDTLTSRHGSNQQGGNTMKSNIRTSNDVTDLYKVASALFNTWEDSKMDKGEAILALAVKADRLMASGEPMPFKVETDTVEG